MLKLKENKKKQSYLKQFNLTDSARLVDARRLMFASFRVDDFSLYFKIKIE